MEGDKNSSRATSERVVENSSQDVSPFTVIEVRVGLACAISETIIGVMGDEPSGNRGLKMGEFSSGVVTEDDDGDGGGTVIGSGLSEGRRATYGRLAYGCGENAIEIVHTTTKKSEVETHVCSCSKTARLRDDCPAILINDEYSGVWGKLKDNLEAVLGHRRSGKTCKSRHDCSSLEQNNGKESNGEE